MSVLAILPDVINWLISRLMNGIVGGSLIPHSILSIITSFLRSVRVSSPIEFTKRRCNTMTCERCVWPRPRVIGESSLPLIKGQKANRCTVITFNSDCPILYSSWVNKVPRNAKSTNPPADPGALLRESTTKRTADESNDLRVQKLLSTLFLDVCVHFHPATKLILWIGHCTGEFAFVSMNSNLVVWMTFYE